MLILIFNAGIKYLEIAISSLKLVKAICQTSNLGLLLIFMKFMLPDIKNK